MRDKFKIELACDERQWERHSVTMLCEARDEADERIGFSSVEGVHGLETVPCDRILLYIYLVPRTLPTEDAIGGYPPFPLEVKVWHGTNLIRTETYPVNQWGGASIEITAGKP